MGRSFFTGLIYQNNPICHFILLSWNAVTGRFIEGLITHNLTFSVKITTNQLHFDFRNKVPFFEKVISEFVFVEVNDSPCK